MAFRLLMMMKAPASLGARSLSVGFGRPTAGHTFAAASRVRARASALRGVAQRRFNSSSSKSGGSRQKSSGRSNKRSGGFSYNAYLESHPIMTKSITSMFVVGSGDLICQKFIEERETVQWKRVATMGWIGLTLAGPLLHQWFGFLFRFIPGIGPAAIAKKIAMDQLMFGPLFNPLFMGYIFLLEGRNLMAAFASALLYSLSSPPPAKPTQRTHLPHRRGCYDEDYLLAVRILQGCRHTM